MSVNEKMTAIASAIRSKTGKTEALTLDGMASGIGEVYAAGYAAGVAAVPENCYSGSFVGDGGTSATFDVPYDFDFDILTISGFQPLGRYVVNAFAMLLFDRRTFAMLGGCSAAYNAGGTVANKPWLWSSINSKVVRNADDTVTVSGLTGTANNTSAVYMKGVPYYFSAIKYTNKTDKEILDDFINSLSAAGGTLYFSASRVDSVYDEASKGTSGEWNALIADKTAWTFTFG